MKKVCNFSIVTVLLLLSLISVSFILSNKDYYNSFFVCNTLSVSQLESQDALNYVNSYKEKINKLNIKNDKKISYIESIDNKYNFYLKKLDDLNTFKQNVQDVYEQDLEE